MNLTILKEFFARLVRTRAMARHFRRLAILEMLKGTTVAREVPPTLAQTLLAASRSDVDALLAQHLLQASGEGHYQLHAIVASYAQSHFVERDEQANQQAVQTAHATAEPPSRINPRRTE